MPTIAAMAYKYSIGQPFVYPRNDLSYAENFLHMMFSTPAGDEKIDPVIAKATTASYIRSYILSATDPVLFIASV